MRSLLDVSALIALLDPNHIHHDRIQDWWAENGSSGWATCPITQNGFVRIVSQPAYGTRFTTQEAVRRLAHETARPDHRFWPDDIEIGDPSRFNHAALLGHNQITDMYLLGLAVKNGGRFVTLDRGVSRAAIFIATPDNLVIVA